MHKESIYSDSIIIKIAFLSPVTISHRKLKPYKICNPPNFPQFAIASPDPGKLAAGLVVPWCKGCSIYVIKQAVGIVGAVIMPHNLYLHSALVRSREIDRRRVDKIREANLYYFIEAAIALAASFLVNMFVVSVFAQGYFPSDEATELCKARTWSHMNETGEQAINLESAGIFLGKCYGKVAAVIWGLGLLAAGQSSTMTGTYSGQFVMEVCVFLFNSRFSFHGDTTCIRDLTKIFYIIHFLPFTGVSVVKMASLGPRSCHPNDSDRTNTFPRHYQWSEL